MAKTKAEEMAGAVHDTVSAATEATYGAASATQQAAQSTTQSTIQGINRGSEQTVTMLKDGMTQAAAGFEKTQARVKEGMDKAMKTAEEFVAFGQGNLEAMVKSGQIWATGVQDLSKQLAATAQASFEESMSTFKALTSVRSVKDAFDLQANYARATLEKAISESGRLTDASIKLTEQTLAPLSARVSLAVEKFAKTV